MAIQPRYFIPRTHTEFGVDSIRGVVYGLGPDGPYTAFGTNTHHADLMVKAANSQESGFLLPEQLSPSRTIGYKAMVLNVFYIDGSFRSFASVYDPWTNHQFAPPQQVVKAQEMLDKETLRLASEHMPDEFAMYTSRLRHNRQ